MSDNDPVYRRKALRARRIIPNDFSSQAVRDELRRSVDPKRIADVLTGVLEDPSASHKDRLAAAKLIMDRRDGMPVAMVLTAHASVDRALFDLPDAALTQIEGILQAQLEAGDDADQDDPDDEV